MTPVPGTQTPPTQTDQTPASNPNHVPPTVVANGVSVSFGSLVAVSDVSFAVGPGVTGLLGPNGAGKSTLIRVLCGLTAPTSGSVSVVDGNPRTDAGSRAQIGLVPQQDGVFEGERVYDFVRLCAVLSGVADPDVATRQALEAVELPADLSRPLGTFSKGMRQRAKIAAAIVHDPAVLVLDEPLNGLDPRQRRQMIDLFHQQGLEGRTVLISSHVLEEVERFGRHVLVIAKGRLAAQGDFNSIRNLMDDQPLRFRISCDDARTVASELFAEGLIKGCEVTDGRTLEVTTVDVAGFRRRLPVVCQRSAVRLEELSPLDANLESVFRYLVGPT